MDIHKNARLTVHSRAELVRRVLDERQTPKAVAAAWGVCVRTVRQWVARFQDRGTGRPGRPLVAAGAAPSAHAQSAGRACRRATAPALDRASQIAEEVGVSPATVSRILKRLGLNRLKALEPAEPVRRYDRQHPGELIHIDIKKLGRFERVGHRITGDRTGPEQEPAAIGWEFVHVCIDDDSRLAFSQVLPDERKGSAVAFLEAAVAYYNGLGITVERVMTDNGSCYRSRDFAKACKRLALRHIRTQP